jgi:hypothetical protein
MLRRRVYNWLRVAWIYILTLKMGCLHAKYWHSSIVHMWNSFWCGRSLQLFSVAFRLYRGWEVAIL